MTEPATIRVLIVDNHEGVRLGLTIAFATVEDMLVVGEATSGEEALRLCREVRPDVVLMELQLPDQDGIGVIQLIRQQFPHIQVVVLTTLQTEDLRQQSSSAGARGYVQKYIAVDGLIEVIRAVNADALAEMLSDHEEETHPWKDDPTTKVPGS